MDNIVKGWVIYNPCHPTGNKEMLVSDSFAFTRKEAIQKFIKSTGSTWNYWRLNWGFKCVKAESIITVKK